MSTQPDLDPWRDLLVGLTTAASLQASIRHADTKAAALLTIEGAVTTAVVDRALPLAVGGGGVVTLSLATLLATSFVIGVASATWQLVLALRPRLEGASGANRFGFPNLVRGKGRPPVASTRRHRDEAWDFVAALARIAMAKHLRIRRSMPWLVVAMTSASGLVIVMNLGLPAMS
ncbi:hypothetical protein M8C17_06800 [Micromonospora sp. RHAY321]|uniref:hypothetical protein n=1 Tax=Micromonospora sp. RHAY321 TaxID=2944807 RepID=UPI00207CA9D7|nr:hypothetical protein [Micromonospora sp. RHAY321]MCO1594873.1 hypothetical protein [Micromonospora sp. RHAY321]